MSKNGVLVSLFSLFLSFANGQECEITLSGFVLDKGTSIPLELTNIYLEESGKGTISDSLGYFKIENLCKGDYHLRVSHIGCETISQFLTLQRDTIINIFLIHHDELLDEVIVHGEKGDNSTEVSNTLNRETITRKSNKNLSDILENIAGVSSLKNGSGISKPVIHGLYGNRVAILNNGISQAGQQWGNDHAPEIDPFVADHLSVIKGAAALAYPSNALGSVVLVEADKINQDPHLHGQVNYIFQSNGLGHTFNTMLEKNDQWAAWRISGTLKLSGDNRSPDYFLTNTGRKEGDIALQLEKDFGSKWQNQLYYSWFNTEIGILRGSHVGNLTDLEEAIGREVPFYTNESFSYNIESPRQLVSHHLIKLRSKYKINEQSYLNFQYGGQLNNRDEFDVRRSGRSEIPALSLKQLSHFLEGNYNLYTKNDFILKSGIQFTFVDNTNNPETGILPLIPDYRSYNPAAFLILKKEQKKVFYEFGMRYNFKHLDVLTISKSVPRIIERFNHKFHNYAASGGLKYKFNRDFKSNINVGYMLRAPEVNELYSFGLHQGVSGIEEGDRNLVSEKSLKVIWTNDWSFRDQLFVQFIAYFQHIDDYIYLEPQDSFRLTIRGAFPVFQYKQTDVNIYGGDLSITYEPRNNLKFIVKYAIVRGDDVTNNISLVNIPADNIFASVNYSFSDMGSWKNNFLSLNGNYTFKQWRITEDQDFLPPPDAYFLLGLSAGTSLQFKDSSLKFSFNIENLLNQKYRDYLNRLRYFADDLGINISLGINYSF